MSEPVFRIFPKFLQGITAEELATRLNHCGIGAVGVILREGYWTPVDDLAGTIPGFRQTMAAAGIQCDFATWSVNPEEIFDQLDTVRAMADHGITGFRMGYFSQGEDESYAQALQRARDTLRRVIDAMQPIGMRLVYQVHHGRLITSPESAALLCDGIDPQALGIMLDNGNQSHEGRCQYNRATRILGASWTDFGVKDVSYANRQVAFAACQDGSADWSQHFAAWQQADRLGMLELQPFYEPDNIEAHTALLHDEVAYLRQAYQAAVVGQST